MQYLADEAWTSGGENSVVLAVRSLCRHGVIRVAVKELNLSDYFGETTSITIYTHYGKLI